MAGGTEVEFDAYVRARYPALRRLAFLLAGDWTAADDLVQTALVRCERRWSHISSADPHPYVRRAILNGANNWRTRRRLELPLSEADTLHAPDDIGRHDTRAAVLLALRDLPLGQRQVIVLRYYEGLPERAIAAELGISVGTVKSRAARGLGALRATGLLEFAAAQEDMP